MPEGTKVGDAYVDTRAELNVASIERLRRKIKAELSKITVDIKVQPDESSVASFSRKLNAQLRKQHVGVRINVDAASLAKAKSQIAMLARTVTKTVRIRTEYNMDQAKALSKINRALPHSLEVVVHVRVDNNRIRRTAKDVGNSFGSHLLQGIEGIMSLLPGRLESLFTKTGPIAGTAFLAAFAGAVVIGLPALGAMIGGVLFASLGLGAVIAAAVVGAAKDPRVSDAAHKLGDSFMNNVIYHPQILHLGQVVADQLNKVTKKLDGSWGKNIRGILEAGGKFLPKITDGLIGMVDGFLGPLDKLMNSRFMSDLMDITAKGLTKIGEAFGEVFGDILKDPEAMEGMKKGLEDLFNLIAGGVKTMFDFLRWLSRVWEKLNKDPDGVGPQLSPLDKMRDVWRDIKDILDGVFDTLDKIFGKGGPMDANGAMNDTKNTLSDIAAILKGISGNSPVPPTKGPGAGSNLPYGSVGQTGAQSPKDNPQDRNGDAPGFSRGQGGVKGWWSDQLDDMKAETSMAWAGIQKRWDQGLNWIKARWNQVWADIKAHASAWWGNFTGLFAGWNNNIKNWWNNTNRFFKERWNATWGWVKAHAQSWWGNFIGLFSGWLTNIQNWWTNSMDWIKRVWNAAWGWIKTKVMDIWGGTLAWIGGRLSSFANWFWGKINSIRAAWNFVWGWIKAKVFELWNATLKWVGDRLSGFASWFWGKINAIRVAWNYIWGAIKAKAAEIWNACLTWIGARLATFAAWFWGKINSIRAAWHLIWTIIKAKASEIWDKITGLVKKALGSLASWFWKKLTEIRGAWSFIWTGMQHILGGVWTKITNAVKTGINWVIDVINWGIDKINAALGKLGIGFKIDRLTHVGGGPTKANAAAGSSTKGKRGGLQAATGGHIRGPGGPTSDSIPAWLSDDEYVIKARSAKKIGYHALDRMNATGRYAGGGRVGPGNNGLLEEHRNHVHVAMMQGINYIIGLARKSGFPAHPTSTFRPGDPLWHGKGKAVDFGGYNQDGLASYFMGIPGVMELIHRTKKQDYAIFGGKASAGGGGGLFGWLGKGWNWVLDHLLRPAGNAAINKFSETSALKGFGKGWTKTIFNKVVDKAKVEFEKQKKEMEAMGSGASDGGNASRWTSVVMQALKMLKLPNSWLGPTIKLIARESGGNPRAINNWDSNAAKGTPSKGLMQTIGPTFESNKYPGYNNIYGPLDNILAGLTYIRRRYGSIFNVQQAVGTTPKGYDHGGVLPPGGYAMNAGRKPEMVLSPGQGAAFEDRIRGGGCNHETKVYVDGVAVAHRTVVDNNNAELVRTLRTGIQ